MPNPTPINYSHFYNGLDPSEINTVNHQIFHLDNTFFINQAFPPIPNFTNPPLRTHAPATPPVVSLKILTNKFVSSIPRLATTTQSLVVASNQTNPYSKPFNVKLLKKLVFL